MRRIPWAWLGALALGIAAGLAFAWILAPDRGPGTQPRSLRADYKDRWREAIAASYAVTGDLGRARARLELLGDLNSIASLSGQAQRALASGQPFDTAQELARLASDLQSGTSSVAVQPQPATDPTAPAATATPIPSGSTFAATSPGPTPVPSASHPATVFPTPSPVPSPTPMPSPSVPFRLVSRDEICDPKTRAGLLQVTIMDKSGTPLPGIEITVTWDQGADRFFTGLQPEINPGYADYTMNGGTTYSVQVARLGVAVAGLTPPICRLPDNQPYLGGLQLTFSAP